VNALGLYDLDRRIRPVGQAYKDLIAAWRAVLPTQSICLQVPVILPSEFEEGFVQRRMAEARERRLARGSAGTLPGAGRSD